MESKITAATQTTSTGVSPGAGVVSQTHAGPYEGQVAQTHSGAIDGNISQPPENADIAKPPEAVVKNDMESIYSERFAALLHGFGMKASSENIGILRLLYENGIPLTKENMLKMNHAIKLTGSSEKALFMFENEMKLTTANSSMLEQITSGGMKISNLLLGLVKSIGDLQNIELREKLTEILARPKETLEELMSKQELPQKADKQTLPPNITPVPVNVRTYAAPHLINMAHLGNFKPMGQIQMPEGSGAQSGETAKQENQSHINFLKQVSQSQMPPISHGKSMTASENGINQQLAEGIAQNNLVSGEAVKVPAKPPSTEAGEVLSPARENSENTQHLPSLTGLIKGVSSTDGNAKNPGMPTESANLAGIVFETGNNPLEISRFYTALQARLVEIAVAIAKSQVPQAGRVMQSVREIIGYLEFTAQIKNQIYVQLPVGFGDGIADMSLYVFKDANKTSVFDGSGTSSAFLSLETSNLGLFETFVQKKDKQVNCQFRVKDEKTANLVREYVSRLDILLNEQGLSLTGYGFTVAGETFTIVHKPKKLAGSGEQAPANGEIPHFDKLV